MSFNPNVRRMGLFAVGTAALTGAGALPAGFVIHAASMSPGGQSDAASVRSSVRASLELAAGQGFRTVAFPAIGAGIGGLSLQACAEVSLEEVRSHLEGETSLEEVRFVLMGEPAYRVFEMVDDAARVCAANGPDDTEKLIFLATFPFPRVVHRHGGSPAIYSGQSRRDAKDDGVSAGGGSNLLGGGDRCASRARPPIAPLDTLCCVGPGVGRGRPDGGLRNASRIAARPSIDRSPLRDFLYGRGLR